MSKKPKIFLTVLSVVGLLLGLIAVDLLILTSPYYAGQTAPSGQAVRTPARVEDTRYLCGPGYPGPGGKADCDLAKKLYATPGYVKIDYD